jgi:predicted nucleic acid-binding protein
VKTLVDTNVLIDIITQCEAWSSWAETALRRAAEHSTLAINAIIFAEVGMKFARIEDANAALVDFAREALPFEAGFLAGKAFLAYKKAGRLQTFADAGLLCGCARGHRSHGSAHPGCRPIPKSLPRTQDHRPMTPLSRVRGGVLCPKTAP